MSRLDAASTVRRCCAGGAKGDNRPTSTVTVTQKPNWKTKRCTDLHHQQQQFKTKWKAERCTHPHRLSTIISAMRPWTPMAIASEPVIPAPVCWDSHTPTKVRVSRTTGARRPRRRGGEPAHTGTSLAKKDQGCTAPGGKIDMRTYKQLLCFKTIRQCAAWVSNLVRTIPVGHGYS